MANPWFRLYAEFATDPKVQMLSESMQRRLLMLFCFRCNGHVTLQDEEVTFMLRISAAEWEETKRLFVARGFIDGVNGVLNWDKRQYRGDSSAERVAKHRAAKKTAVQQSVTPCNVTVTTPDTEQNRIDADSEVDQKAIDNQLPSKADKPKELEIESLLNFVLPDWIPKDLWDEFLAIRKKLKAVNSIRALEAIVRKLDAWRAQGHDPTAIIEKSITSSWKDVFEPKENHHGNRNTPRQPSPPRQPRRFAEQNYDAGTEGFVLVDDDA